MSISDFVCYVLKVPADLNGFVYTCKAIKHVLESGGEPNFYEALEKELNKDRGCIERCLRLAKEKALKRMLKSDYKKIFGDMENIKGKEFICYSAQYYRKEFMNEDKGA